MKSVFLLIACSLLSLNLFAFEPAGDWSGAITLGPSKLNIVFHISQSAEAYKATMDSPDQGAFGIPVTRVLGIPNFVRIVC